MPAGDIVRGGMGTTVADRDPRSSLGDQVGQGVALHAGKDACRKARVSLRSPSSTLRYTGMGVGAGLVRLRLSEHWLDAGGDHVLSPEDLGHERLRLNDTSHRGALGFQSRLERWMSREPVSREDRMNFSPRSAFAVPMDGLGFTTARWCRSGLGKHGRGRRPPAG